MAETAYKNFKITALPNCEVEIEAEVSAKDFLPYRNRALKKLTKDAKIPGFRPGHIPEKVLVDKLGESGILEEAAQMALSEVYPNIVLKEAIDVLGRPEITITKIAAGNPLGFKIKTAILPTFDLPDYVKISKEILKEKGATDTSVKDGEVDAVLLDIRKTRAQAEAKKKGKELKLESIVEKDLPPLTDKDAKGFGEFKNLTDFRDRVKENLKKEKIIRAKESRRGEISEKLIEKTKIMLPNILVESELHKMLSQMKEDITRMGMKYEDYLKNTGKTEEGLCGEWRENAKKRAKLQLIMNAISDKESLKPSDVEIDNDVKSLLEHYKDADPDNLRIYVRSLLSNEKVFAFLEGDKGS
ncbi:hypothetical protein IIB51_00015 [Patescibacteria group bacterium]|nr:hypothetical protein [Patescibacteria group bacterium]